jgi:hypothetical protein
MPKGLKITNRTGQVLYDSTWIAGVDYDKDKDSDDSNDDDDDEDMYDEMDPEAIAALNDPTTLQDDEDSEDSDEEEQPQVKEPDEEEESEEESKEEQDPNPTTAEEQTIPENAQMTRSGRISKPRQVLNLYQSHLQAEAHQEVPYFPETTATSNSTYKGKTKVLYVKMLKAIYGMLQSSLLYYKKFRKDIESIGFKANPYDPHVTNHIVNGNASSGEHTRHFHIKFFYITDLISRNEIHIKYCPTEGMIADYMTKPLVDVKFEHFRKLIMNLSNTAITS